MPKGLALGWRLEGRRMEAVLLVSATYTSPGN